MSSEGALGSGLEAVGAVLSCARRAARAVAAAVDSLVALLAPPSPVRRPAEPPPAPHASGLREQVEEAKYWLGPDAEPAAVDRETGELPRAYGRDRIVLLPRDPWWMYAYWEVTPTTRVDALRQLDAEAEGAREVLRVYDVTFITFTGDNAWSFFDVELPPGTECWYLAVGKPATAFCVEVGLRTPSGRFVPLARSNTVTTARATPSPDTTVRWVTLRRHGAPVAAAADWTGARVEAAAEAGAALAAGAGRSSDVQPVR